MQTHDLFTSTHQAPQLSVLSFGAGQDSTALLYKYVYDEDFRVQYAPNDFIVICADTGNEFPDTYTHIEEVKAFCLKHDIAFFHITADMGYHTGDWQSLQHFYEVKQAVGSKAYPKICSQRLKIDPIYRFLEDYLASRYGVRKGNKKGIRQFALESGKIQMMIGIAKGEEKRTTVASDRKERWYRESIEHVYPLIDLHMDRELCQRYIESCGHTVPIPSNCMMCPFLSEEEYLRRFHPQQLEQWIYFEKRKLDKWRHLEKVEVNTGTEEAPKIRIQNKNLGVWGKRYLPEMVSTVKAKFASWSDADIIEYRMSHGHCVSSSF